MTHILKVAGRSHGSPCFISELKLELTFYEASKPPNVLGDTRRVRSMHLACLPLRATRALHGLNMIYVALTTFSEIRILTKIALTQTGGPPERANMLQLGGYFTRIRLTQTEPKSWQVARKLKPVNSPIEQGTMT